MRQGKRERALAKELQRWKKQCNERANAVPFVPKNERPHTSLENAKVHSNRFRPNWDYNANTARSIARKSKPKSWLGNG